MQTDAEARLAEARAELIRDRATFERQVSIVLERLTVERQKQAEQVRSLMADRSHFVLIGRRLRRRWIGQKKSAERALKEREALLHSCESRLEKETTKNQKERATLRALRERLVAQKAESAKRKRQFEADIAILKKQRTALVDFRICVEADCRRAEERRTRLHEEICELERRVHSVRQHFTTMQKQAHAESASHDLAGGQNQKVA